MWYIRIRAVDFVDDKELEKMVEEDSSGAAMDVLSATLAAAAYLAREGLHVREDMRGHYCI
jgi:hypothetical protein